MSNYLANKKIQTYNIKKIKNDYNGQTSVEMILLIGAILTISLIIGVYVYKISTDINTNFQNVMGDARDTLINKI